MDRGISPTSPARPSVPHARGDGPPSASVFTETSLCSPRTWGWTVVQNTSTTGGYVFPTHVGMDRIRKFQSLGCPCVPHARGDGPNVITPPMMLPACSPRTWGWTVRLPGACPSCRVFPTHVGMDRRRPSSICLSPRVPHARGDGPDGSQGVVELGGCSPRTWGWTAILTRFLAVAWVFPTHVGMDRDSYSAVNVPRGVPHARGDGPYSESVNQSILKCSPRTWGWTGARRPAGTTAPVFPTHVGMDRTGIRAGASRAGVPHARGDGPSFSHGFILHRWCSPRTWGWTVSLWPYGKYQNVFPTHVGMDRERGKRPFLVPCVPHARGDGPVKFAGGGSRVRCSPRTWGWTDSLR